MKVGLAAADAIRKVHGMNYTVGTSPDILCKSAHHCCSDSSRYSCMAPAKGIRRRAFMVKQLQTMVKIKGTRGHFPMFCPLEGHPTGHFIPFYWKGTLEGSLSPCLAYWATKAQFCMFYLTTKSFFDEER